MEEEDLAAFRASWEEVGDGAAGLRYVQALCVLNSGPAGTSSA